MDNQNVPNHQLRLQDMITTILLLALVIGVAWIAVWLKTHTYTPPECCAHGHPSKVSALAQSQHAVASPGALTPRVLKPTDSNSSNCIGANCGIVLCK